MTQHDSAEARANDATMPDRPGHYWEDLRPGDRFRGPGITITDAHLIHWAGLTGDTISLHLDETYAATTSFGRRIAHGPLSLALSLGLMTQTGYLGNILAWLGLGEVDALAPVYVGDTIRPLVNVAKTRPFVKPGQGVWVLACRTVNQNDETVMTFTSNFLIRRRNS